MAQIDIRMVASDAFGNALGDSIASANGQSSGVPGPVGADERARIMGYFADGPGTGPDFADDMAMRRAANNPMGLATSNGVGSGYGIEPSGSGMLRTGMAGAAGNGISDADIASMRDENLSRAKNLATQSLVRDGGSGDVQGWMDAAGRYHVEFGFASAPSAPAERNFLMEGSAAARASAVAPYNEMIANSDSWIGKAGGVVGRIGTNVGYDLADAGIGLYTLATDGNARAQLGNTLGYAATHPFNAMYAGYNKAEAYLARTDASQIAEDGARLLWGGVATAGTGKVVTTAGVASVEGAVNTARWLAPKAAEVVDGYLTRVGGKLSAVESGPSLGNIGAEAAAKPGPVGPLVEVTAEGNEVYYRAMNPKQFAKLTKDPANPALPINSGGENMLSPIRSYIDGVGYDGVLVRFEVQPGTTQRLLDVGVRDNLPNGVLSDLPQVSSGWKNSNALFKGEGTGKPYTPNGAGVVNIGLGNGPALSIFNESIAHIFELMRQLWATIKSRRQ